MQYTFSHGIAILSENEMTHKIRAKSCKSAEKRSSYGLDSHTSSSTPHSSADILCL